MNLRKLCTNNPGLAGDGRHDNKTRRFGRAFCILCQMSFSRFVIESFSHTRTKFQTNEFALVDGRLIKLCSMNKQLNELNVSPINLVAHMLFVLHRLPWSNQNVCKYLFDPSDEWMNETSFLPIYNCTYLRRLFLACLPAGWVSQHVPAPNTIYWTPHSFFFEPAIRTIPPTHIARKPQYSSITHFTLNTLALPMPHSLTE